MPSDFLTPFMELDDEFCKNFLTMDLTGGVMPSLTQKKTRGFQRRHSTCPVTLPNSKFNNGSADQLSEHSGWPLQPQDSQHWSREMQQQLPRSCLNQIPFRVDRSVSMIESQVSNFGGPPQVAPPPLAPPPGLGSSTSSLSPSKSPTSPAPAPMSSRYKTELCRTFDESGTCKYGSKCQFAHGTDEVRGLSRHPKYKTEPCRTFHTIGFCPYGARCHFIHNADEQRPAAATDAQQARPQLRQSISFAGFSTRYTSGFQNLNEPLAFSRASSVSPPPSTGSPELLSPIFPEPRALKHSYPFYGEVGNDQPATPSFYAVTDSNCAQCPYGTDQNGLQPATTHNHHRTVFTLPGLPLLQRSASADSLSDQEDYTSSSSLSGSESPSFEGRRLPIFSRISVSDD
ncbi:mRNA decay activator protein ZFP36L2-B-like isoform X1 [Acipenser ruthenus]|nr:mRNA decay activator protein ZFP36L2-B-like isoform X1 [Acipenser ruthenus]